MSSGFQSSTSSSQVMELTLTGKTAEIEPTSDIFVVNRISASDSALAELISLMGKHGALFYESQASGMNKGHTGLIARDDTIIIKVNGQWDERGGTNTDLLKALIQAIVHHPDGFTGEIIVADNGQGQFGAMGQGGSFGYDKNNAKDTSQSSQKVVDSFTDYNVSTYLWDNITTTRVSEYSQGDFADGYVVDETANPRTGLMVSYPKFKTRFGTYISFKMGTWNSAKRNYDSERLKVINLPVLKSHRIYGVTGCVKHYMGVVSDKLTRQLGTRSHDTVGRGGMGTEMVETRFPVLNIIDALWINANPAAGPRAPYDVATKTNVIAASTDPVALDYWAAKNVLLPASRGKGYSDVSPMDPDYLATGSFGQWLRLSMEELNLAGYQTTVDETRMNVYVQD